jgi:hypothetical protein
MVDTTTTKSPFARLDTSLMRSTNQNPGTQEPRKKETQDVGKLASQEFRNSGTQEETKRASYPKKTYNLHPDVVDMIDEIKRKLARQYQIKASREEIVEEALREVFKDFDKSQETSKLVIHFTRNPETQET